MLRVTASGFGVAASASSASLCHCRTEDSAASAPKEYEKAENPEHTNAEVYRKEEVHHPINYGIAKRPDGVADVGQYVPAGVLEPSDVAVPDLLVDGKKVIDQTAESHPNPIEEVRKPGQKVADHASRALVEIQRVPWIVEHRAQNADDHDGHREDLVMPQELPKGDWSVHERHGDLVDDPQEAESDYKSNHEKLPPTFIGSNVGVRM